MKIAILTLSLLTGCTVLYHPVTGKPILRTSSDTATRYLRTPDGVVYYVTRDSHSKLPAELMTRAGQSVAGVLATKGVLP